MTNGALQQFYTPLDLDWYSMISSYYGYRKNPITGDNQFHRGIDIAVPEGTEVYAAQDGTVTTAGKYRLRIWMKELSLIHTQKRN